MFSDFAYRQEPCEIRGQPERVVLTRNKDSANPADHEHAYKGLFAPNSIAEPGDLVRLDRLAPLIVLSLRPNTSRDKTTIMVESNGTAAVQRLKKQYDSNDNPIGEDFVTIVETPGFIRLVSGDMRQRDPGLLATTTHVLQVPINTEVPRPKDGGRPARIVFEGQSFEVAVADSYKYPGALYVQLTEDHR